MSDIRCHLSSYSSNQYVVFADLMHIHVTQEQDYGLHSLSAIMHNIKYNLRIDSDIDTVKPSVLGRLMEATYSKKTRGY